MTVDIYKAIPRLEWAPSGPSYFYRPEADGHDAYCRIETPDGWMLVGEPQPQLVFRVDDTTFRVLNATDALSFALARVNGFSIGSPPVDGAAAAINQENVRAETSRNRIEGPKRKGLPVPSRNGKPDEV